VIHSNHKTNFNKLICNSTKRRILGMFIYNLPVTQEMFARFKIPEFHHLAHQSLTFSLVLRQLKTG